MELSKEQKSGLLQLISFVIGNRTNSEATDLSYMELLDLKNVLQQDEEPEKEYNFILKEDGIQFNLSSDRFVKLNEKIRNEELHEYSIIHRESFIDELYRWIGEAKDGVNREMMKNDLDMLKEWEDVYIFTSNSTNSYIGKDCSEFNKTCEELVELNETL
jgi:hypothetical protein